MENKSEIEMIRISNNQHNRADALMNDILNAMRENGKLLQVRFYNPRHGESNQNSKVKVWEDGLIQIDINVEINIEDLISEWCKCYYNNIDIAIKLRLHHLNVPDENIKIKNLLKVNGLYCD